MTVNRSMILHIGTHKTGTTSVQKFALNNSEALRSQGIWYPNLHCVLGRSFPAHHHFSHALSDEGSPYMSLEQAQRFIGYLTENIQNDETILLSAEPFYRHILADESIDRERDYWKAKASYIERVRSLLRDFDIKILVYLRPQDSYAFSLYSETILNSSFSDSFPAFVSQKENVLNYAGQLVLWAEYFGADNIIVETYEGKVRGYDYIKLFFERLGCTIDSSFVHTSDANITIPWPFVKIKRLLNRAGFVKKQNLHLRNLIRSIANRCINDRELVKRTDKAQIRDLFARFSQGNTRIADTFCNRKTLFDTTIEESASVPADAVDVNSFDLHDFELAGLIVKESFQTLSTTYSQLSDALRDRETLTGSIRAAEKANEYAPHDITPYLSLYELYKESGDSEKAEHLKSVASLFVDSETLAAEIKKLSSD